MSPDDEWKKRLNDGYQAGRSDFRGSRAWAKWKALPRPVRFFAGAGIIFAVVIGVVAVVQ